MDLTHSFTPLLIDLAFAAVFHKKEGDSRPPPKKIPYFTSFSSLFVSFSFASGDAIGESRLHKKVGQPIGRKKMADHSCGVVSSSDINCNEIKQVKTSQWFSLTLKVGFDSTHELVGIFLTSSNGPMMDAALPACQ